MAITAMIVGYVLVAAATIPPDMGKGPVAEMRDIVPLIAFGCVLGSLAVVVLWRTWRPMGAAMAVLLMGTNWLYLDGMLDRCDGKSPWWPPTLYRYVQELRHPYHCGDDELLDLLRQLPAGATVRMLPPFLIYPPMFYVPQLHYCDQLTLRKPIRAELRPQLPDYLFIEKARPEIVIVPAHPYFLGLVMENLKQAAGPGKYRVAKALQDYFFYTDKPEIPGHWFSPPPNDWVLFPGQVVLVATGSQADRSPALASDAFDRKQCALLLWQVAITARDGGRWDLVDEYAAAALRLDPSLSDAEVTLGSVCELRKQWTDAMRHYRRAIEGDAKNALAHYDLARLLAADHKEDEAEQHYLMPWPCGTATLRRITIWRNCCCGRDGSRRPASILPPSCNTRRVGRRCTTRRQSGSSS